MNFLPKLLQGLAFVPAVVSGIEGLFGKRAGADKRESAISFIGAACRLPNRLRAARSLMTPNFGLVWRR